MGDNDPMTFQTPDGPVTLPWKQVKAIADRLTLLKALGKVGTWHKNQCDCCYSVHEDVPHPTEGWVVGEDGGETFLEGLDVC